MIDKKQYIFNGLKYLANFLEPMPSQERLDIITDILATEIDNAERYKNTILEISKKERIFPAPATIIEHYKKDDTKNKIDLIMKAVSRFGSYQYQEAKASLGEDVYGAVKAAGGWVKLCESTDYDRERFLEPKMKEYFKELPSKQLLAVDSKQ